MQSNVLKLQNCKKNVSSIVFSVDNNYLPYLSVTIRSLIDNSSKKNFYNIYVLETDISEKDKQKIKLMETNNIQIIFVSINRVIEKFDRSIFYLRNHFSTSAYFRFFIPHIFKDFDKILYCDCDAIFFKDPAELFDIDLKDNWLGVVHDTEIIKQLFTNTSDNYYADTLKLKKPKIIFKQVLC